MANIAEIMELYTAYFNRAADKDGVDYWANEIDTNGWTLDQVAQSFAEQAEYTALYAGKTNAEIVTAVYTNVLNRDADEAGAAYWVAELDAGTMAVTNLIQAVVTAGKEDKDGLGDAAIVANKTAVSQHAYDAGSNATDTALTAITAETASVTTATDAIDVAVQAAADAAAAQAAADQAAADAAAAVGSTVVFSDKIDALIGTTGDDIFVGDALTLSSADQVAGQAGNDTAKLYDVAAQTDIPTLDSVENLVLVGTASATLDVSGTGATNVTFDNATDTNTYTIGADQLVTVSNMAAETLNLVTTATDTTADLTVTALGTSAAAHTLLDVAGTGITTINLTAATTASYLTGLTASTATALTNLVVSGDTTVAIGTSLIAATTNVDASAMTAGGLTAAVDKAIKTVTGGAGDDVIAVGDDFTDATVSIDMGAGDDTLNLDTDNDATTTLDVDLTDKNHTLDGGEGEDILVVAEAEIADLNVAASVDTAVITNFETIQVGAGANANDFDMDLVTANSGATNVWLVASAGIDVSNMVSGSTLTLTGTQATDDTVVTVKDAAVAGHTSDVLNINLDDDSNSNSMLLTVADVEILNINSDEKTVLATELNEVTLDVTETLTINVTGNEALDLNAAGAAEDFSSLQTLDASALTAELTVDISTAAQGVVVTAGTKTLTIIDSTNSDVITGSAGDDAMTLTGGADSVTGNGGQDTFNFDDGDSTSTAFTTITDFGAGANGDIIDHVQDTLTYEAITASNQEAITADTTLANAITQAFTQLAANEATSFEYDGAIYVVAEEATSGAGTYHTAEDLVIKIEGVTAASDFHADNFA